MRIVPPNDIEALNRRLEGAHPEEIVRWALEEAGLERPAVASSFQAESTAVIHLATRHRPDIPVLFLDTGFHFGETLAFKEELARRLDLNVVDLHGDLTPEEQAREHGPRLYERDPVRCCQLNKVLPLNRALRGHDGWLTGLRRDSAPTRAGTPIVSWHEPDPEVRLLKVNPVASWTSRQVWRYLEEHDLPRHPLYRLGYASIGCAPCTRVLFPGEEERAGRWAGVDKVECGIHLQQSERA